MLKHLLFAALIGLVSLNSHAQFPSHVLPMDVTPNTISKHSGDLSQGMPMDDLSWAANSSVACFPATQNAKFRGNHTLHSFTIPPYSEVTVKLIPRDKKSNFSLYGYQIGTSNFSTPPALNRCTSCEADHKWDRPKVGKTQDHTRSIFFNSIRNSYNIVVGVVGGAGQIKGGYDIEVNLKSRVENTEPQAALKIYSAKVEKGKTVAYKGDLKDGCKIQDLSWASSSSNACFPATQNAKFSGNHIFFVTEIPPRSKMNITVIPDDKDANFSIYAYQDGTTSKAFPPALPRCVSCEAEHKWDYPKRGKTQNHTRTVSLNAIQNPYRVVIGVAGADGLTSGGFRVQIETE